MHSNSPKVGMVDVLRYFWIATKKQKWGFYYTLFAFTFTYTLQLIIPLFYKKFFDLLGGVGAKAIIAPQLVKIIVIVLILHGVIWIFNQVAFFVLHSIQAHTMARIRQMSFNYMVKHSYSFFTNNFAGALVQRVGRFTRSFEKLQDSLLFHVIPLIVNVVGIIIIVYLQHPAIAYIIIAWAAVTIIYSYIFQKWKLKYDVQAAKADTTTTAFLSDAISNQDTVASFAGFNVEAEGFRNKTEDQAKIQKFSWNIGIIKDGLQIAFIFVVEFFLFYYAIKYWQDDLITIGTFVLIQVYIIGLADRLWSFGRIVKDIYESFADSKEMVEILETPHEIKDLPGATDISVREGKIIFENISFAFNETRTVIENLNLEINGGEKVALIGPSGAGKSTIVKLLLRMYDLTSGNIKIDNQDIKNVTQDSLRKNISLVPQDPILFHRTLMENIRYGREDASDEEVIQAAKLAHCDEFIDTLPLKYETFVGERGIKLSGGERQRVAIARAILKNAPILILDEATSSLDSHSESLIQDALDKLMRDKTSIVIAHRLSTISKMDRVIVVADGKIIEQGSHNDLINRNDSLYKKLWDLQAGGFLPKEE